MFIKKTNATQLSIFCKEFNTLPNTEEYEMFPCAFFPRQNIYSIVERACLIYSDLADDNYH